MNKNKKTQWYLEKEYKETEDMIMNDLRKHQRDAIAILSLGLLGIFAYLGIVFYFLSTMIKAVGSHYGVDL